MVASTGRGLAGPIAYLTGEYPRATDTFIQREVFALREHGLEVLTCSIRKTGAEHHVGPEQRQEAKQTFYIIAAARKPLFFLRCHLSAFFCAPGRYFSAIGLALRTAPPGLRAMIYQLIYFAEAVVLADYIKRRGVVHLHNHIATANCTVAMLASTVSAIPFSFTMHGPDIFFEPGKWRIDEKIARARFVACISDFCRSQGMIFSKRVHWAKMHVVHCGVVTDRYGEEPSNGASVSRLDGNELRLLFVGRLAAVKGVPVFFEALTALLESYPKTRVTLIGDGAERPELEAEASRLGLSHAVEFAGYKSQAEVALALRQTDIFVLPSFAEGVPVVLMEAMASRVPVVATRIAGIPELIEDGESGLLVPPGDAQALTSAIYKIAGSRELRADMGLKGRAKVVDQFNIEHEGAWLAELIQTYQDEKAVPPSKRPGRPSEVCGVNREQA